MNPCWLSLLLYSYLLWLLLSCFFVKSLFDWGCIGAFYVECNVSFTLCISWIIKWLAIYFYLKKIFHKIQNFAGFLVTKVSECELLCKCMANFMSLTVPWFWKQKLFMIRFTKHEILLLQLITAINFQVLIHTNTFFHPVWKQTFSLLASTAVYFLQYQINDKLQQLMLHDNSFMNDIFLNNSFVSLA